MEDLHITEDSVQKMLEQLDPNKSPGPDGIHPRFLNETAETLCVPLKTLFPTLCEHRNERHHKIGKMPIFVLFSKKETPMMREIIDQLV